MQWHKISFGLLWVGLITYSFFFAPPDRPETLDLIINLSAGQWQGINPLIIALFNLMGVLPFIYGGVLFFDGRGQKIPAFPFAIGSFFVGAFAILPYLVLRQPNPTFSGPKNWFLKIQDSRWFGFGLAIATFILIFFGLSQGDWSDFVHQWQTSRFIHVMSLDFCLLSLLFPVLLGDDLARRNIAKPWLFWLITSLPLLGPVLYLSWRQPIIIDSEDQQRIFKTD